MAYNKTTKPGTDHETYGDYHKKSYATYKPGKHESLYGIGEAHRYSTEEKTEPIKTSAKKELKGNIDRFPWNKSTVRPIHTTTETYRG